jgi:uncharacterized lipoprotein YehR (DUF1307 family)
MKKFFIAIVLAVTGILSGCNDDDDKGSFKITQDGTEENVSVKVATLTVHDAETSSSGRASHVLKIEGLVGEDSVKIMISNWDFQEPPDQAIHLKSYYNAFMYEELEVGESNETCMKVADNQNVCEGAIISYTKNGKMFYSFSNDEAVLIIAITACDGQRTSGNFDLSLENPHNLGEKIQISGVFKDLKYTIRHS